MPKIFDEVFIRAYEIDGRKVYLGVRDQGFCVSWWANEDRYKFTCVTPDLAVVTDDQTAVGLINRRGEFRALTAQEHDAWRLRPSDRSFWETCSFGTFPAKSTVPTWALQAAQ
ncbi:MAG TPA: hypothetical protein VKV77_14770 [Methylovirgula sp.]|nr:hypothetical protein [Methylovirgula sp.]